MGLGLGSARAGRARSFTEAKHDLAYYVLSLFWVGALTGAQHEQEERAALGERRGVGGRHDLDAQRAKLRRQLPVHVAVGSCALAGHTAARRGEMPVVRAEVEYRRIDDLL